MTARTELAAAHLDALATTLDALRRQWPRLLRWGALVAERLADDARLLVAGNGGSAAEAQHLTAELVGRFDRDRRPYSAIALHADSSSLTAIANDYGYREVFARQVTAHARPGDVLLLLSTSGRSENLLAAARAGTAAEATVLALTGPGPNPLAGLADDALCLPGGTSSVQEAHLVAAHLLCTAVEAALGRPGSGSTSLAVVR
ncbi:MAG TPA: SIS domain-containing protein [Pseudonocardiaceae bacterium]